MLKELHEWYDLLNLNYVTKIEIIELCYDKNEVETDLGKG